MLGSQALETPQLGFRELNEPDLAWLLQPSPNPLDLTWLCTKASWNLAPKPPILRNLLWDPVDLDLALHQSLPFSGNLLRNPVEPDLALHISAPKPPGTFSGTFSRTLLNLTWLCTKASHTFSETFSGLLWNLLRNPVEPDLALHQSLPSPEPSPEPSSEPCWTWPGSAPKPPRSSPEPSEPSLEPPWTWPGACTSAHRSYSGLKTPLAYFRCWGKNKIKLVQVVPMSYTQTTLSVLWWMFDALSCAHQHGRPNHGMKPVNVLWAGEAASARLEHRDDEISQGQGPHQKNAWIAKRPGLKF